jgi:NlpC/P60 family putative phage cell wall peptidase
MRRQALTEARKWIGTPYHHQASRIGAGCDCLGLVRGVWRALYGREPQIIPPYAPAAETSDNRLREALGRWLIEISKEDARPGDVLLFRWKTGAPSRHCGVQSDGCQFIHAYWQRAVCETSLTPWWQRRISAAYSFPESD